MREGVARSFQAAHNVVTVLKMGYIVLNQSKNILYFAIFWTKYFGNLSVIEKIITFGHITFGLAKTKCNRQTNPCI